MTGRYNFSIKTKRLQYDLCIDRKYTYLILSILID